MNFVDALTVAAKATGYRKEAVVRDYAFADILEPSSETRTVPLVAFTHTPPSYRTAAFAAVRSDEGNPLAVVNAHRALGAPLLFVVSGDDVTIWQVRPTDPPRAIEKVKVDRIPELFDQNRETWNPDSIHRAKSIGAADQSYQLDFIDLGLLPAIEGEIHTKLDRLLVETLTAATGRQPAKSPEARQLFRVVFRLLAAKVLRDRGHPFATNWDMDDLGSVLASIESYYSLAALSWPRRSGPPASYQAAWNVLREGISFSNISSDDLAFVYENTLVTPEARKLFGTHSTPRQVAEYVVQQLGLHRHDASKLRIYEPFTGAGVFLVSALRHLRDTLPVSWTDHKRHEFLIKRLSGDEIDPFACEVATLSLILADYPNHNGWHIGENDLFEEGMLHQRMESQNVILCNPPFEAFSENERNRYQVSDLGYSKPIAVLNAALEVAPLALGFVLPRPFILEKQYAEQRRQIEKQYASVELVELPDRTFGVSKIEAALLIAKEPRDTSTKFIKIRSSEIADRDRVEFLKTGAITTQRIDERALADEVDGSLWIPSLSGLWEYLESVPKLGATFKPSLGLQWNYHQDEAYSEQRKPGFIKGLHSARRQRQFAMGRPVWLDNRRESVRRGFDQDWSKPKLIMNAGRLSRGPWRIGAALDMQGLAYSQQFIGLRPKIAMSKDDLLAYIAILNGPIANAFIALHSPANRIRVAAIDRIPVPAKLPNGLSALVDEYVNLLANQLPLSQSDAKLEELLLEIDALVLEAYDLPPRLENELFEYFRDTERPSMHDWDHWDDVIPHPGLRLSERTSKQFDLEGNWIESVFRPLPRNEAALLHKYGE